MGTTATAPRRVVTMRRRWPVGMRHKLVSVDMLKKRMAVKGFSARRLAKYAECVPGTIDNLIAGRTQSLNKGRTAELICEALDVPMDLFFVSEMTSVTSHTTKPRTVGRAA
ncbi:helix-turn-helix domain-containing protein [Cellulomonas shaoxiangyii]|uniref:XRE family transcriptional regulator n=1 Tax=Cellulomonas shaoxiangyii TaxID=2566013 RepID=A0A4P7SII2_9CELL|nr:helix-turn-helix transcriptional regulator [Cellulomonas shaoxiangyii]QCB93337.1 hypothetical protein E5225_06995 [Cellulomonas shaoxiangyii]TGY79442.1 hypothetical protein E5226_15525 [Cellulomonas shaoxiangyii]